MGAQFLVARPRGERLRSVAVRLRVAAVSAVFAVVGSVVAAVPVSAQDDGGYAVQVGERDVLIAAQENLLNAYRCLFGVDLQVVEGGCPAAAVVPGPLPPGTAWCERRSLC